MNLNLHVHTHHSDGRHPLFELVQMAQREGVEYIAITDHDSVEAWSRSNIEQARLYVDRIEDDIGGVRRAGNANIIQGIELSARHEDNEIGIIHVVGLFLDYTGYLDSTSSEVIPYLHAFKEARWNRGLTLCREFGINETRLGEEVGPGVCSRLHIGAILFEMYGTRDGFTSPRQSMEQYLRDKKFDPDLLIFSPEQAIECIYGLHGVPFLAHPTRSIKEEEKALQTIERLRNCANGRPLGIGVIAEGDWLLAKKTEVIVAPGTDYHGKPYDKPNTKFGIDVEPAVIERLLAACDIVRGR